MGLSFSNDGLYVGWSSLFNYSSEEMIDASKTIPLPRGKKLIVAEGELYSIELELTDVINSKGANRIRKLANLIYKIDNNNGRYNYLATDNASEKEKVIKLILKHENYKVSYSLRELAYKNVASANIRNVVHTLRNRDLAYSPITMRDLLTEADKSPKGAKTKLLNMMNPLTKYIMLNQNLVGKNVIGIAANGEKDWFNLTYYYHNILRTGNAKDLSFLKMNHSYSRISGRATDLLMTIVVRHIPDLLNADPRLAEKIKEEFYKGYDGVIDMKDKLVDLLISLLLSAATDNAKELILAKINAGTNLAKYHLHLIMMGFKLLDIVSFMTSPVVELIDKYSGSDLYKNQQSSVNNAIKILNGDIDISKMIVRPYDNLSAEAREALMEMLEEADLASLEMLELLLEEGIAPVILSGDYLWITGTLGAMYLVALSKSLKDFILKYIKSKIDPIDEKGPKYMAQLRTYKLPSTSNMNTNYLFLYIDLLIDDVHSQIKSYNSIHPNSKYSLLLFKLDLNEFSRITDEANETSTLASVWLKLNLGIPSTDIELIKRIKKMLDTVSVRERAMRIYKPTDVKKIEFVNLSDEEVLETKNPTKKEELLDMLEKFSILTEIPESGKIASENLLIKTIRNILSNNPELAFNEIISILIDSVKADLYGNFDLYKYLNDTKVEVSLDSKTSYNTRIGDLVSYRELAATYYNLIKSSWNILDIVNRIPHYKMNLDLLNYTVLSRHLFANKSKMVDQLISLGELSFSSLTDRDYRNITLYADKLLITSYFLSRRDPIDLSKVENTKVYDSDYSLVTSDELSINTLNGIDSLKNFVENNFFEWLKTNYADNVLVKELVLSSNKGKSTLRTALNLFEIDESLTNKLTFNKYLIGIKELANEPFDSNYSVADILMLYNLAINGTKLGGKYMTGVFRDLVLRGTVLYDYFLFISKLDYTDDFKYIIPTKKDFLIAIAPQVSSTLALAFSTAPYVKVISPTHGYDIYRQYYDNATLSRTYKETPELLLRFNYIGLTPEQINERIYNYATNSVTMFPELHLRLRENTAFLEKYNNNVKNLMQYLAQYIRLNRLLIYKLC